MKVNCACFLRKQSAVNSLRAKDRFDRSSGHGQRWSERYEDFGIHLGQRLDSMSWRHNKIAWDVAVAARFDGKVLIGQNWRAASCFSSWVCGVPHFVRDDRVMLATFLR
jgi:hypothetical protein